MSRDFFGGAATQELETKAFSISGGTGSDRFKKMNETLLEFKGKGAHIHGSQGALMTRIRVKNGGSIQDGDIENPVLLLIEFREKERSNQGNLDSIRELAVRQGNVIELTPTSSLQCGN